jgi:hypothetical protein
MLPKLCQSKIQNQTSKMFFLGDGLMRSVVSLLLLAGLFLGVLAGCSREKTKIETPSYSTAPPPAHDKQKPLPRVQEK